MKQVVVAGAGAVGLAVALALAKDGAAVTVRDPAAFGDNASGVAAGMLAPAFETALDPLSADHFPLLKAARDLWPALAKEIGLPLDRSGAVYRGREADAVARKLRLMKAEHTVYRTGEVFTPEDWRLRPRAALTALANAAAKAGVRFEPAPAGPMVDPEKVAYLTRAAASLLSNLAALEARAETGVRAATPDGLPLVGWSAEPRVLLAVGARRNGWLLAPLVAGMVAAYLRGDDPGPFAAQLDARRFSGGHRP